MLQRLAKPYNKVYILRLGHRPKRDKRVTTHVALVARAFGANGFILANVCDEKVVRSLRRVLECWGGEMHIECGAPAKGYVREWRSSGGEVIHLTMYGLPVQDVIEEIRSSPRPKLIVVGAEKVEGWFYENADYNVAITPEPHSEIAALALFLDRLYRGRELLYYEKGGHQIVPHPHRKRVTGGAKCW